MGQVGAPIGGKRRLIANIIAALAAAAAVLVASRPAPLHIVPLRICDRLEPVAIKPAQMVLELAGVPHSTGGSLLATSGGMDVHITAASTTEKVPALAILAAALTLAAGRAMGFRALVRLPMALIAGTLALAAFLALWGVLVALMVATGLRYAAMDIAYAWIASAAPAIACAIIVALWRIVAWVSAEDDADAAPAPAELRIRPPSFWAATVGTGTLAAVWLLALCASFLGAGRMFGESEATFAAMVVHWLIGVSCAGAALAFLVAPGSQRRWAWTPLAVMVALGGEMNGGVGLMLVALAAGDEKMAAWAGRPVTPAAIARIRRRMERPLREWLGWIVAALVLVGGVWGWRTFTRPPVPPDAHFAAVGQAIDQVPLRIGNWTGQQVPLPAIATDAAEDPIVMSQRQYTQFGRTVTITLVHVRHPSDLLSRYQPLAYQGQGWSLQGSTPIACNIEGRSLLGTEHVLEHSRYRASAIVACWIAMPNGEFASDLQDMSSKLMAAPQWSRSGVLAIQFACDGKLPAEERHAAYQEFLAALAPVINAAQVRWSD